jgi:hypothetical protein
MEPVWGWEYYELVRPTPSPSSARPPQPAEPPHALPPDFLGWYEPPAALPPKPAEPPRSWLPPETEPTQPAPEFPRVIERFPRIVEDLPSQPQPSAPQQPSAQDPWARLVDVVGRVGGGVAIPPPPQPQVAYVPETRPAINPVAIVLILAAVGAGIYWVARRAGRS